MTRPQFPERVGKWAQVGDDGRVRAILFDEDEALSVARRLVDDGYQATLTRERYAGEDDDADHPWAITTDAPHFVLELMVDDHDGWVETEERASSLPPLDLPAAPKRIKRPDAL